MKQPSNEALIVIDIPERGHEQLCRSIVQHIKSSDYDEVFFTQFRNMPASNFVRRLGYREEMDEPKITKIFAPFLTGDNYFVKHTYSALKQPELQKILEKFDTINICGTDTDACVLATAYDAFDQGYGVNILFELCVSKNKELHNAAETIAARNINERIIPEEG